MEKNNFGLLEDNKKFLDLVCAFIRVRFVFVSNDVAKFISSLAALESDFGRSNISIENNNIVGMKLPHTRISTAISENRDHAVYNSWQSCICDFFYWCQYAGMNQNHFKTVSGFVRKFRTTKYNPNPEYCNRIMSLKTQYYG